MQGEGARGEGARHEGCSPGSMTIDGFCISPATPSGGAVAGISRFRCPGPSTSWTARREETTTPGGRGDPRDRRARPRGQRARGGDPQGRWPRALRAPRRRVGGRGLRGRDEGRLRPPHRRAPDGPVARHEGAPEAKAMREYIESSTPMGRMASGSAIAASTFPPSSRAESSSASASASAPASAPACTLCAPPQSVLPPGGSSA